MNEIDLVPGDYRSLRRVRGWLRALGLALAAAAALISLGKAAVVWRETSRLREIEAIRVAEREAQEHQSQLESLRQQQRLALRRLTILSGLRGGISSDAVFLAVDRALDEGIWFLDWSFRRAGQLVHDDPEAVHTGYFLVVPLGGEGDDKDRAWRLETHMEILGQARDHSTLAGFVNRLLDQPRIQEVRIVNTRAKQFASAEVVDFELAVVVRTGA